MNVSAVIPTRGDHDLKPILNSLPSEWEKIIWDNGEGVCSRAVRVHGLNGWRRDHAGGGPVSVPDLSVYGRYAAIEYASHDLIFTQDDDVIVSDPSLIVEQWQCVLANTPQTNNLGDHVVCNMPPEFRPHYPDSALVGFGAAFHRDAPARAFARLGFDGRTSPFIEDDWEEYRFQGTASGGAVVEIQSAAMLRRECDRVFTCLTPRVLVDVPKQDRGFASDPGRLWKQPGHQESTRRMLDLARQVRDA